MAFSFAFSLLLAYPGDGAKSSAELLRTPCNGEHTYYLHHARLNHAAHAALHADTTAALACMCPIELHAPHDHDHMIAGCSM